MRANPIAGSRNRRKWAETSFRLTAITNERLQSLPHVLLHLSETGLDTPFAATPVQHRALNGCLGFPVSILDGWQAVMVEQKVQLGAELCPVIRWCATTLAAGRTSECIQKIFFDEVHRCPREVPILSELAG